jgi:hypothetical protein
MCHKYLLLIAIAHCIKCCENGKWGPHLVLGGSLCLLATAMQLGDGGVGAPGVCWQQHGSSSLWYVQGLSPRGMPKG